MPSSNLFFLSEKGDQLLATVKQAPSLSLFQYGKAGPVSAPDQRYQGSHTPHSPSPVFASHSPPSQLPASRACTHQHHIGRLKEARPFARRCHQPSDHPAAFILSADYRGPFMFWKDLVDKPGSSVCCCYCGCSLL